MSFMLHCCILSVLRRTAGNSQENLHIPIYCLDGGKCLWGAFRIIEWDFPQARIVKKYAKWSKKYVFVCKLFFYANNNEKRRHRLDEQHAWNLHFWYIKWNSAACSRAVAQLRLLFQVFAFEWVCARHVWNFCTTASNVFNVVMLRASMRTT